MAIIVKEGYIRFKNKSYKVGETVKGLSQAEEDKLISKGIAEKAIEGAKQNSKSNVPPAAPETSAPPTDSSVQTPAQAETATSPSETPEGPATSMPPVTPADPANSSAAPSTTAAANG
ncbi:hypothetical protein [Desulfosporosinus sp. FKB]|uniref:hypothetical protein n=1 Tax=Desulfosporosinus sp. FKB TaxID=1969835 RepID=UPI000B499E8C|nr:hypothetical protein [Desulfosporosinus sp. FKB]